MARRLGCSGTQTTDDVQFAITSSRHLRRWTFRKLGFKHRIIFPNLVEFVMISASATAAISQILCGLLCGRLCGLAGALPLYRSFIVVPPSARVVAARNFHGRRRRRRLLRLRRLRRLRRLSSQTTTDRTSDISIDRRPSGPSQSRGVPGGLGGVSTPGRN